MVGLVRSGFGVLLVADLGLDGVEREGGGGFGGGDLFAEGDWRVLVGSLN